MMESSPRHEAEFHGVCRGQGLLIIGGPGSSKTKTNSLNWNKGFFQIKNKVGTNVG
jgi:hypothetical protein